MKPEQFISLFTVVYSLYTFLIERCNPLCPLFYKTQLIRCSKLILLLCLIHNDNATACRIFIGNVPGRICLLFQSCEFHKIETTPCLESLKHLARLSFTSKPPANEHFLHLLRHRNTHGRRIAKRSIEQLPNDSSYWVWNCKVKRKPGTMSYENPFSRVRNGNNLSPAVPLFQLLDIQFFVRLVRTWHQCGAPGPLYWTQRVCRHIKNQLLLFSTFSLQKRLEKRTVPYRQQLHHEWIHRYLNQPVFSGIC